MFFLLILHSLISIFLVYTKLNPLKKRETDKLKKNEKGTGGRNLIFIPSVKGNIINHVVPPSTKNPFFRRCVSSFVPLNQEDKGRDKSGPVAGTNSEQEEKRTAEQITKQELKNGGGGPSSSERASSHLFFRALPGQVPTHPFCGFKKDRRK
uniref:Serpentine receptor class gamma n=1 Tax=Caenorhabditis japonica TaxID=281687 RepID=A0A8R1HRN6_CAEJA